jgi:hypothetical protein
MAKQARSHRITKRDVAYLPRSPKPYQCKRCAKIFRTKHAALNHQCEGEPTQPASAVSPQPAPSPGDKSR